MFANVYSLHIIGLRKLIVFYRKNMIQYIAQDINLGIFKKLC